ncbi:MULTISPECIES: hypothetical protein [Sorangium]|uniref:Secreted protein n=1 Tax=Sorangium cellulosum TaxID=56 RepID=A0A4P2R514_SORCE|nr:MULTISPECIES: hypothetical protein [Sorangium]AUX38197.1 uncharacterized protein SOCE836_104370 [Sorangium cellulosum]WCQ97485.1 hypothetical protein NQZ70_10279 [Sorangium sp. Soce836]
MVVVGMRSAKALLAVALATSAIVGCSSPPASAVGQDPEGVEASDMPLAGDEPVSESDVKLLVEGVAAAYAPEAQAHGAQLTVRVTGSLTRIDIAADRTWNIIIGSDLFRPGLTRDLATFIGCHEVGHALGGFPFKDGPPQRTQVEGLEEGRFGTVSASEGQSDYFASKDCLPRMWGDDIDANGAYRTRVSPATRARCDGVWAGDAERDLCYRIAAVANDFGVWLGGTQASTDTPSTTVVTGTNVNNMGSQCRVDTIFAGALCQVRNPGTDIPGLVPPYARLVEIDPTVEADAAYAACAEGPGARPLCWFRPNSTPYDCSFMPEVGDCAVTEEGVSATRFCSPRRGIEIFPCAEGTTCELDEEGFPVCELETN